MSYNIDTLFYQAVGVDGGNEFTSDPFDEVQKITFIGDHPFRRDGIEIVVSNKTKHFGKTTGGQKLSYTNTDLKNAKRVKVGFRTSGDDFKVEGQEYAFGGVYRISLENTVEPGDVEKEDRSSFNYLEFVNFHIPAGFKIAGFHGRAGARLDKFGIALEAE